MAEVKGFLREDSTQGEKIVKSLLQQNLPKEYTVYVETPIRKKREIRYPDFIVLTNYGVIVLEVKDWVMLEGRADPSGVTVRTRSGECRHEKNPVNTTREYAIALSNELNTKRNHGEPGEAIPWSYAAILTNLPTSVITQLRVPWGEDFVLGKSDLENPDILLNRIKNTFPSQRMRPLLKAELDLIRATIFPIVEIEMENRPVVILDEQQERIVAEPVRQEIPPPSARQTEELQKPLQEILFPGELEEIEEKELLPPNGDRISRNTSIRLVRGFSGSGKTLVLMQRARYLFAQYPAWKIGVFTYNKPLQEQLEQTFAGTGIKSRTFHSLCYHWIATRKEDETNFRSWVNECRPEHPILDKLDHELIAREIDWLRDLGNPNRDAYLSMERKGIGKDNRLAGEDRAGLYDVYEAYRNHLKQTGRWDWPEIPILALEAIQYGNIQPEMFDAVLIDEAQDWAPVWFKIINRMVHPEHGVIFLADDPSQSIYRCFSWKEKDLNVVGRTRWLRVPYRNTFEIYQAAYSLIANHAEIRRSLAEEGEVVEPDLTGQSMRHGPLPIFRKCISDSNELVNVRNWVDSLRREGYPGKQIAVLTRYRRNLDPLQNALRGSGAGVYPIHSFKGLEMEAVIIPHIQDTFQKPDEEANERRLMYMAMTRARSKLIMTYSGKLPRPYEDFRRQKLVDFIE